jgi:hypothetical protein
VARDWPSVFDNWHLPVSETENEKCERAERMIRSAIDQSAPLKKRTIRVFTQGSYRNDTNVRNDSDVDIAVCCTDVFVADYFMDATLNDSAVGVHSSDYTSAQLKNEVGEALSDYFGASGVTRGNKAFDVHETTSRVDADVVPCLEHRNYVRTSTGGITYVAGTHIRTDAGEDIENYPEQHAEKGRKKNSATNNTFKRVVRILKRLRNEMRDEGIVAANPMASFLIESLVWNAPDSAFSNPRYYDDVRAVLLHIYSSLSASTDPKWMEINGIKFLFHVSQPWTKEQVISFVNAAWAYVGFA